MALTNEKRVQVYIHSRGQVTSDDFIKTSLFWGTGKALLN